MEKKEKQVKVSIKELQKDPEYRWKIHELCHYLAFALPEITVKQAERMIENGMIDFNCIGFTKHGK